MSDYKQLFDNKEEEVLDIFSTLLDFLHDLGPFDIEVKKTSLHLVK
ncbi:hypothetical protein [Streptococcus porcinus]|uniref:Uncharacterized protein n=2 Tax=Streptococcus porcinus TaxID=1340 RepID=A0A7W0ASA5_STRPO|nr:hypothetical protein [Streptococcus porcinus]MBA2796099.1 hypothetical protein [Streptococcus porcinus]